MSVSPSELPCPTLTISIDVEMSNHDLARIVAQFPAKPGVFVLDSGDGQPIALFTTASLRRAVESRLLPPPRDGQAKRRVEYRHLTRRIRACTVGSAFEADWAYLQWARQLLPHTYRAMLDRWQAWFVHCDPAAPHPQWVKSAHPNRFVSGVVLGPFPDKHAAGKYMEILLDTFDLCRYHHILVQAPHATACAYKEMGRCPAPCDGSISADEYRRQFDRAIEFASTPVSQWRAQIEQKMKTASAALDFEAARLFQRLLDATKPATRAEFAFVNRFEYFRFVAVAASERPKYVRLFVIRGGWVEPFMDIQKDASIDAFETAAQSIIHRIDALQPCISEAGTENIGLVCWHLFRPRTSKSIVAFRRVDDQFDGRTLQELIRKLERKKSSSDDQSPVSEQAIGDV